MFEMDHGTRGARITALFSISKARALEEFSAFSHRSFVSIIARVWLQETIEVNMLVIRTPKKGVELSERSATSWHIRRSRPVVWKRPA